MLVERSIDADLTVSVLDRLAADQMTSHSNPDVWLTFDFDAHVGIDGRVRHRDPAALSYEPEPDGGPPPMVCYPATGEEARWVELPNGAPELLLLSRRTVIAALTRQFRVDPPSEYGTTGNAFRGKGHLLRLNPPRLTAINGAIAPCLTRPDPAAIRRLAESVATSFGSTSRPRDLITGFCEPLTARFAALHMRVPHDEWALTSTNPPTRHSA